MAANKKSDDQSDLDFFMAIEAHVRWKVRLEAYINRTGEETLDPNIVGRDDQCALGKWIYGAGGATFGDHPKFPELRHIHAEFHKYAAEVIRHVDSGEFERARELLTKGDYAKFSQRVKAELARLALEMEDK